MPGSVIPITGLTLGPVGSISQTDFPLISPRQVRAADTLNLHFGEPAVVNPDNTVSSVAQFILNGGVLASNTKICVAKDGVLTNPYYPLAGGTSMPAGLYPPGYMMANLLDRGTFVGAILNGTPAGAESPAFIRSVLNSAIPLGLVGQFEAVADGTLASAAFAGNTGNATAGTLSLGSAPQPGIYRVVFLDATHFNVFDPLGNFVGTGVAATPFTSTGVNFTVTAGGTPMVRGDGLNITTTMNNVVIPNIVFKTGILSTDPVGQVSAQLTILERKVA